MKYAPIAFSLLVAVACGGTDSESGLPTGIGGGSGAGGTANATGGKTSIGGSSAFGGSVTTSSGGENAASGGHGTAVGGGSTALGGQSTNSGGHVSSGGAPTTGGAGQGSTATGGAADGATSCDSRNIRCRVAQPVCEEGEVPSVVGTCYGPCVKIDACACASAEQCPEPNRYTCLLGPMHCSYYLR